ncbi:MAG TPA: twin-arginine translocation signal domain-containing protein, partial [Chryseosolibacter sp.]
MPLSRRNFLALTAATGGYTFLNSLQGFAKPLPAPAATQGFRLLIFATNWGYTGSWAEFAAKIKDLGYDGAEVWYPSAAEEQRA